MRLDVTDSFGQIKVGNTLLPGVYQGCSVSGRVKTDEINVSGQSGKSTQPQGFEDATIYIQLRLLNDNTSSAYDKAKTIIKIFRAMDKNAKPFVYRIVNNMTNIWGIKEVIFTDLTVSDSNTTDTLDVSISFREYKPITVKKEKMAVPAQKQTSTKPADTSAKKGFSLIDAIPTGGMETYNKLEAYRKSKYPTFPAKDDDAT